MFTHFHQPNTLLIPDVQISCRKTKKSCVLKHITQDILNKTNSAPLINGLQVITKNGWWMVRASDIRPALMIHGQATCPDGLIHLKHDLVNYLDRAGIDFPSP